MNTTVLMPARAPAAATALARLPVDGQANTLLPNSPAADKAPATTRSLNGWVGLPEASLTHGFFGPSSRAGLPALSGRVRPASMLGFVVMSVGTGTSGW